MEAYSLLALKLLIGILGLVFQINILGKGNLAPTSAMDQVQNFVLGGIIGGVIYSDSIGLLQFFLVLILWTLLVLSLKFIKNHNRWIKSVIDGKSVWVIINGKIQAEECMKNGISAHDLMFKLRAHLRNLSRQTRRDGTKRATYRHPIRRRKPALSADYRRSSRSRHPRNHQP